MTVPANRACPPKRAPRSARNRSASDSGACASSRTDSPPPDSGTVPDADTSMPEPLEARADARRTVPFSNDPSTEAVRGSMPFSRSGAAVMPDPSSVKDAAGFETEPRTSAEPVMRPPRPSDARSPPFSASSGRASSRTSRSMGAFGSNGTVPEADSAMPCPFVARARSSVRDEPSDEPAAVTSSGAMPCSRSGAAVIPRPSTVKLARGADNVPATLADPVTRPASPRSGRAALATARGTSSSRMFTSMAPSADSGTVPEAEAAMP